MPRIRLKSLALEFVMPIFFFCAEDVTDTLRAGPVAIIAPHEDDDILSCGAAIAHARRAGVQVKVFFVTDGSRSSVSAMISPEQLSAMRRVEAVEALAVLGVEAEDVVFLNTPDNCVAGNIPQIASVLEQHLAVLKPAVVFSPYGIDPHPDHAATAVVVEGLVRRGVVPGRLFEYPRFKAASAVSHLIHGKLRRRLRRVRAIGLVNLKREALAKHRSQCERLTDEPGWNVLEPHWTRMFFKRFELFVEKI